MPKKSNSPSSRGVLIVAMVATMGVVGFAAYVKMSPNAARVPDDLRRSTSLEQPLVRPAQRKHEPDVEVTSRKVDLLIPAVVDGEVKLSKPASEVPKGMNPMVFATTETLKSFGVEDGRALGVQVKDKTALLDVNEQLVDHGFGSTEEGQVIKALQMVLGQFSQIDRFELIFDGNKVDSLGSIDLTDPIPVVRPGQTEPNDPAPSDG